MRHLRMDRIVTILETKNNAIVVGDYRYNELERVLINDNVIKVTYRLGQKKRRVLQLKGLGFQLKKVLDNTATEKHHPVIEMWERIA